MRLKAMVDRKDSYSQRYQCKEKVRNSARYLMFSLLSGEELAAGCVTRARQPVWELKSSLER